MRPKLLHALAPAILALGPVFLGGVASAEPQHAIAMYGAPALEEGFAHLPYANPDAPKGGRIRLGESGSFDSLNPWILKGRAPVAISNFVAESLMGRSYDEPFTLYGLLAESIETDDAREWVEFTLRPEARFSDGSPVTVEDVMWSYETLGTQGHPRYQNAWRKVAKMEQTGPRSVRFTFSEPNRELALIMGMRPVLKKAQWDAHDFAEDTMTTPIGSGAYRIARVETGKYISLERDPNWWGKDLAFNRGRHNFDEMRFDYFNDGSVVFEAFKGGELDSWRETNLAKWARNYDFPAVLSGDVIKSEIPHARPSGIQGFVMNTRNPIFADWRVREAMMLAFNFEFINATLNDGVEPRISSYFANSSLAMQPGPATGKVAELLAPYADSLLPGVIAGYTLPVSDGSELNRKNTRKAIALLEEAGWKVDSDGVLKNAAGAPFRFEILLQQGTAETSSIVDIYVEALRRLGIVPSVAMVDDAQYTARRNAYDFDMTWHWVATSLSPGNEQYLYWGRRGVTEPGSRNLMGMDVPAAEAMIDAMLNARSQEDFVAAVQALDRILTAGRYVIPIWYARVSRLAHIRELHFPERLPLYGDWPGFQPDVWWYEAD
ncbi:extracellular solute-binding protein [Pseudothioclava arenosa]|uniref:ABC transporter substrate-binding protein n=1 Tax=Pseudothioclava arenosa TaxID=1795308 RepID=A0A2A4CS66_9RHOB|nr:extracellular solute-binding protein [Pseudothioclava arenosa]PCD76976.1 ABC transporter substrate-binding protein [Pseudothioclava arenosa]